MRKFNVSVIGCGAIAEQAHIPAALRIPEVALFAVADTNIERARCISEKLSIPYYCEDYHDLLGKTDAAIITCPNSLHVSIASTLLRSGVHVLCEKPMATSVKECQIMAEASLEGKARLMIAHNKRYLPNVRLAKKLLSQGLFGPIQYFEGSSGDPFTWATKTNFYRSKAIAGGGALMDVGVHLIDLILWFAESSVQKVKASYEVDIDKEVEEDALLTMWLTSGAEARIEVSRKRRLQNFLTIKGQRGWIRIYLKHPFQLDLYSSAGKVFKKGQILTLWTKACDPFVEQLGAFVKALSDEEPIPITPEDGIRTISVIEEAYAGACTIEAEHIADLGERAPMRATTPSMAD